MYIAYSALRTNEIKNLNQSANGNHSLLRYEAYVAACQKYSTEIAAIQKYLPGWMPKRP